MLAWQKDCDTCKRIAELQAKLERLGAAWDKYFAEAWHHEFCPMYGGMYGGSTHGKCACGYEALCRE